MTDFLIRLFGLADENPNSLEGRAKYGDFASKLGLVLNLFLFIIKIFAAKLTGAISVAGEAVNNLSDFFSSLLSMVGFKISSKPPDSDHPYGHGRSEYIFSSFVSFAVIFVGLQLFLESIKKIRNPQDLNFSILSIIILIVSIFIKLFMYYFYRDMAKRIDSDVIKATSLDSKSDILSSSVVLVSLIFMRLTSINIDGILGMMVSMLIIKSGYDSISDTFSMIIGKAADDSDIEELEDFVSSYDEILGVHDLIVHQYGPNHVFSSIHVEMDANKSLVESHKIIDEIEERAWIEKGIQLIIHLDPVELDNPLLNHYRNMLDKIIKSLDPGYSYHDLKVNIEEGKKSLYLEVDISANEDIEDREVVEYINKELKKREKNIEATVIVDRKHVIASNLSEEEERKE